jgi:hypothetical protein
MHKSRFRQLFIGIAAFAVISIAGLWSFNTLAEVLAWPQAQYKHAIAAIVLLLVLRWGLTRQRSDLQIQTGRH